MPSDAGLAATVEAAWQERASLSPGNAPDEVRAADMLVARGEKMSAEILAATLARARTRSAYVEATDIVATDGVHGCLVAPGDPTALAEAILRLAGAPETRRRMAEAAYARLGAEFGATAGIDRLEARLVAALTAPA